jgi:hypothetical protein
MFRLNCHQQRTDTCVTETYRNKIALQCLTHIKCTVPFSNTVCPTRYRTRHFFNNSNTNEDIANNFEQGYVRCVRNEEERVCSVPNCCDTEQRSASQPGSVASGAHCISIRSLIMAVKPNHLELIKSDIYNSGTMHLLVL